MKTSARFLAMLLAVVMIAGAALSVSAFSDVTAGVDHATAISVLNQLGVIGGYEDGTFKPTQNVTRAEMAKLVYVLYTTFTDAGAGTVKFDDVKADNWAVGYISWCASKGIIGGYGDGNFGPSDNVTYDQALKMVAGTLGYNEWDSAQWPVDVRMKALNDLKLGTDIDGVKGGDKLTRAQVAQIMYNALKAPMKETKTINQEIAAGFFLPIEVNKTLIEDVWSFTEDTYAIVGTENYGSKTNDEDIIAIQLVDKDGNKTGDVEKYELADLGLEAYSAKTDDLINLHITTITKDEEMLASASIKGSVTDNVKLEYSKTRTYLSINGVKYEEENFDGTEGKHQIRLYDAKGEEVKNVTYFADEKLSLDLINLFDGKAHMARVIDFDGDGKADAFVIVPKVAYKVTGSTTKNGVKTWNFEALDGSAKGSKVSTDITAELAKDDIFVGAEMGTTLYAEIVKPVDTYATKLSKNAGKVTLSEVGEVVYKDLTVTGAVAKDLDTSILGKDNVKSYYIYNGEVIFTDAAAASVEYDFVILKDVEKTEGEFNKVTMENETAYVATLVVVENGELVEKTAVLADDSTVAGATYDAKAMYEKFGHIDETGKKRVYQYTVVASYEEDKDGCTLVINEDLDGAEKDYVVVAAGKTISYNEETGFWTVGDVAMVDVNANSAIFYRFDKPTTSSKDFMYLGLYTADKLSDKNFSVKTYGETYLVYNETNKRYELLATILEDEIEYVSGDVASVENYGSLVLYAYNSSSTVPNADDGKLYNEYYFMDLEKIENKDAFVDTETEHDKDDNAGTEEGYLYGYNAETGAYDVITKANDADLATVDYEIITQAVENKGKTFIYVDGKTNPITLGEDVTIWGLGDKEDNSKYTQLTFVELKEMLETVAEYNEEQAEEDADWTDLKVQVIVLKDFNKLSTATDKYEAVSVIVEIYEEDEDGVLYSVNDTIFANFTKVDAQ